MHISATMEKESTHALKLLHTLREAGLNPSTIESMVHSSQLDKQDKSIISILNSGQARKTQKFPDANLKIYFCYKTTSEDYRKEFAPSSLVPYTAQIGNMSYN